jgi:hypothetical protein
LRFSHNPATTQSGLLGSRSPTRRFYRRVGFDRDNTCTAIQSILSSRSTTPSNTGGFRIWLGSKAAMLAPLAPLADALALSWSRSRTPGNTGAFEYGWVRGVGSAAFIAGLLVAGQSAGAWGLSSVLWLTAAGLFATAFSTRFVPGLAGGPNARKRKVIEGDWLILLREPAFVRMSGIGAGSSCSATGRGFWPAVIAPKRLP